MLWWYCFFSWPCSNIIAFQPNEGVLFFSDVSSSSSFFPVEFLRFPCWFFCHLLRENILTPFDLQLENFSLLTHIHLDTLLDEIKRFGQDCFIFLRCFIGDCFLQVHLWFFLPIQMFLFAALAWRKVPNSLLTWAWDLIHLVGTPAFFSLFFLRLFVQVCFCSYPPAHLFGFHYWGAVIQFFSSP